MSRRCARRAWVAVMVAGAAVAGPEALLPESWAEGVDWAPQAVRIANPSEVRPSEPFVPAGSARTEGPVSLAEDRAAVVYLAPLDVLRVRATGGTPRFERIPVSDVPGAAWLRIEEPAVAAREGLWYLAEPMGGGSLWVVRADQPVTVALERPEPLERALSDEAVRAGLLEWIDGRGQRPPLPFHPELRHQLERDLALTSLLEERLEKDAPLREALRAYRKASALRGWSLVKPLRASTSRVVTHLPEGAPIAVEGREAPLSLPQGDNGRWELEAQGPGVLAVDVRRVFRGASDEDAVVEVYEDGVLLGRVIAGARPAFADLPGIPLPLARTLRTTADGAQLGPHESLRVPLRRGRHRYQIEWRAGAVALSAREARRRPWLSDRADGAADWAEWAERASELASQDAGAAGVLLRRELARLDPRLPAPSEQVAMEVLSPPLEAVAAIGAVSFGAALGDVPSISRLLSGSGLPPDGALSWSLRLELVDHLLAAERFEDARAVLHAGGAFPRSGWLAAAAARRVAQLPADDGQRSRELAALELAWRKEPLSPTVRAEYARRFYDAGRWRSGAPRSRDERPVARRFLDLGETTPGAEPGARALKALAPGETARVEILPEEAPRLFRLFVLGKPGAQGTRVRVGDRAFPVPQLEPVEAVELALPAGRHEVRFEGPASASAFASATASASPGGERSEQTTAWVRTQWAVRAGDAAARFRIPDGHLPTPIRVQVRPAAGLRAPVALWLRTDVGEARRLWLHPGASSEQARALDVGGAAAVPTASLTLHLPALVREVWLDPDDRETELYASVAVRATTGVPRVATPPPPAGPEAVERILQLSRELAQTPEDADRLLARAELLTALEEDGLARADVDQALDLREPLTDLQARIAMRVLDRLDADEDDRLPLTQPVSAPTLLRPALGVLSPAFQPRYRAAREAIAAGNAAEGALALSSLYRDTGLPQVGLEALAAAERTRLSPEGGWQQGVASVAYGVASRVAAFGELPLVRRVRREAARWTRWDRLADAERQAGTVQAQQAAPPEQVEVAVRKALLAPPWALAEGRVVRAGNASVLDVTVASPERYGAEVLCRTWPSARDATPGPCRVALRVDGVVAVEQKVPHGARALLEAEVSETGPHQLELLLGEEDAPRAALIRFLSTPVEGEPRALETQRPLTFLRSSPTLPVTLTVLGPTVLRIGARALGTDTPRTLRIASRRAEGGAESSLGLVLPPGEDATVVGTPLPVSAEAEAVVLLPEKGPHQVRLESPDGDVLVRVRNAGPERPTPLSWTHARELRRAEPLPWPALPERLTLMPDASLAQRGGSFGLLSVELGAQDERLSEEEEVGRALRTGLEAGAAYRRELLPERWWLRTQARSRLFADRGPAFFGEASVHGRALPLGLRLSLSARGAFQSLEAGTRWRAGGRASVDRWLPVGLDAALIPSLAVEYQHLAGAGEADAFDLSVYSLYAARHPLRVTPRASLRWQPFQDQLGGLALWAMSNADLRSLDQVSSELHWSSLWTWPVAPVRTEVAYGISWRLADAHRPDAYLRHHLRVGGDWALWSSPGGRLLLFAEDRVHYSTPFGLQNVLGAGLRWDLGGGRGLRDISPPEEEFDHLLDPRRALQ